MKWHPFPAGHCVALGVVRRHGGGSENELGRPAAIIDQAANMVPDPRERRRWRPVGRQVLGPPPWYDRPRCSPWEASRLDYWTCRATSAQSPKNRQNATVLA